MSSEDREQLQDASQEEEMQMSGTADSAAASGSGEGDGEEAPSDPPIIVTGGGA